MKKRIFYMGTKIVVTMTFPDPAFRGEITNRTYIVNFENGSAYLSRQEFHGEGGGFISHKTGAELPFRSELWSIAAALFIPDGVCVQKTSHL